MIVAFLFAGDKLEEFLRSLNSSKPLYLGQTGLGNVEELGKLGLEPGENFCMGGPRDDLQPGGSQEDGAAYWRMPGRNVHDARRRGSGKVCPAVWWDSVCLVL